VLLCATIPQRHPATLTVRAMANVAAVDGVCASIYHAGWTSVTGHAVSVGEAVGDSGCYTRALHCSTLAAAVAVR
jgi:hypothetical protein